MKGKKSAAKRPPAAAAPPAERGAGRGSLTRAEEGLLKHELTFCLVLALVILTLLGVGNVLVVGLLGLILCAVGFVQPPVKVDLWIFIPLTVYNLLSLASSYVTFGNIIQGYGSTQVIFPLLYLALACLDSGELLLLRRLCACWAAAAAAAGIVQFTCRALTQDARRLGGVLGNPNAMGIFLVIGWFVLLGCLPRPEEDRRWALLAHLEPVLLTALALTLSMGSFLTMAVGLLILFCTGRRSWRETARTACRVLARASLGVGTGILLYLSASRTGRPWVCLLVLAYALAAVCLWRKFLRFLEAYPAMAAALCAVGVLTAAAAAAVRPSSIATFAERLEMMRNGLGYLGVQPVLGLGPYQWRTWNLYDGDKYFNTYHIHNIPIHVGVELGLFAMAMLVLILLRYYRKKAEPIERAGFTALALHCMIDTGFFYMGIVSLALLTAGSPQNGGTALRRRTMCLLLGGFAALFAYNCCYALFLA